ncbi:MAG TPA: LamG-like jellyroll fold domain-containing protein, partial [Lacibacter sp.]|nr:LamG-like jellyroll fold domain-containing protein [Lacibacter sp.]
PTDKWFEWAGGESIAGILNDQWHHLVLSYNADNSGMTLYIDGVANPNIKTWGGHGPIRLAGTKIGEYRIGRGPRNDNDGDGESGWLQSSFKGGLDQFRLYSKALTAAEVQTLFAGKM